MRPFQEYTFSAEEYTIVYLSLPDWAHNYNPWFWVTKAVKTVSTYLALPREALITKKRCLHREVRTQGTETVFPFLSSVRHTKNLLIFCRKHSWRVIFWMFWPTMHTLGCACHLWQFLALPHTHLEEGYGCSQLHHLLPGRYCNFRDLPCDFLQ